MKLKLLFHFSIIALIASEAYRAYLLAPFPGSQESEMVHVSYFLYHYRWVFRIIFFAGIIIGYRKTFERRVWIPMIELFLAGMVFYLANFEMTAENFFQEPENVQFADPEEGKVPMNALVIGVTDGNTAHAFPIRYLSYHHKVHDIIGNHHLLITYCDVCRSGIVFDPGDDVGRDNFRLVGMDQWNAIIEDAKTGSWWMQANGICVAGELKGEKLPVYPSEQLTLSEWSIRYPNGKVMLPDPASEMYYSDESFEKGTNTNELTRTDTASWQDKSWVLGVEIAEGKYKAYDWNELKRKGVIRDTMGNIFVELHMDADGVNYYGYLGYKRESLPNDDTLLSSSDIWILTDLNARQMFWHTWRTFYPTTTRYGIQ